MGGGVNLVCAMFFLLSNKKSSLTDVISESTNELNENVKCNVLVKILYMLLRMI